MYTSLKYILVYGWLIFCIENACWIEDAAYFQLIDLDKITTMMSDCFVSTSLWYFFVYLYDMYVLRGQYRARYRSIYAI